MNILFVRRGSITIVDGISTYILELSAALKRMGHQVYILCARCRLTNSMRSYIRENFLVDDIVEVLDWGDKVSYIPSPRKQLMLKKLCRELNVDIVHFNGLIPCFVNIGAVKVMTYHGLPILISRTKLNYIKHVLGYKLLQHMVHFDTVIAVSKKLKEELKQYTPKLAEKAVVIPPGINITKIRRSIRNSEERENIILHVGTRPEKNVKTSMLAFAYAYKKHGLTKVKLVVVGKITNDLTRILNKLPEHIRKKIMLKGALPRKMLLRLIARSKILLVPSLYEAFSILSLEALALGTPIIASTVIPEEVVVDGVTGFKIDNPLDYKAFAKIVTQLLQDEDLWVKLHRNAIMYAERFESKRIAHLILKAYKRTGYV